MTITQRFLFLLICANTCLQGCSTHNRYFDPSKPHHTPQGFKNNYVPAISKSLPDFLRWKWDAFRDGLPPNPTQATPTITPNLDLLYRYPDTSRAPTATWIGHATVLVQAGGLNVLTDPMFSQRASPAQFFGPKRAQPPGVALADLPPIDVVLISHNHNDHLDIDSVLALDLRAKQAGKTTLFLVPLGVKPWLTNLGITNVTELDWWDHHIVKGVEFNLTPVQHWSARGLTDRSETLWGGWAVFSADCHWYFSGDSGYSKDFIDTKAHFADRQSTDQGGGFDLALIAIGAYEPRWFMNEQHVNPAESVKIHRDVGAKRSIGIHWGTFELTDEALDQPPRDLADARRAAGLREDEFSILKIGETLKLPVRNMPR